MCGIAGVLSLNGAALPDRHVIQTMLQSIEHRGPDGAGEYRDESIHLGAVRLAIQDLKRGDQPVFSCDRRTVAIYNGEAYNAHQLRRHLSAAGHRLASQCDTELLPHLYEEYGADFPEVLRGMFAVAVWDQDAKRLILARDRMGMKPLYYARTSNLLIFASEIKAIIASGLVEPEIDRDSIDDLFSLSYPCPPRTMFAGVFELLPAHSMVVKASAGDSRTHRYWETPTPLNGEHREISFEEAGEELALLLRRRVYDHTASDVPFAAYLSGGLDSAAICGLMKDVSGDPPQTFSVSFESEDHDEYANAQEVVRHLGGTNVPVHCGDSMAQKLDRMVWHTELPLQFPLALPMIDLAAAARGAGFPVVLTGEGADEILGGYDCFRGDKMRRILDRPGVRFLRPSLYKQLYKWLKMPYGAVEAILENQREVDHVTSSFGGVYPPWFDVWTTLGVDRNRLIGREARLVRDVHDAPSELRGLLPPDFSSYHPLDAGIVFEQRTRLPSWILLIGDRASMAEGVEARVPFLDLDIVEFVASLPPSHKMRGLKEKAILRRATRSVMPRPVNRRQKRPFYTPIRDWFFSGDRPDFVEEELSVESLERTGLFDPALVHSCLDDIQNVNPRSLLSNSLEWTLFLVLQTQMLHRMFVDEKCKKSPLTASSTAW